MLNDSNSIEFNLEMKKKKNATYRKFDKMFDLFGNGRSGGENLQCGGRVKLF